MGRMQKEDVVAFFGAHILNLQESCGAILLSGLCRYACSPREVFLGSKAWGAKEQRGKGGKGAKEAKGQRGQREKESIIPVKS